jgi:hypothetical protein
VFLSQWLDAEVAACTYPRTSVRPSEATRMARIEWLIRKLIVIDPDGVNVLRMFFMQTMVLPQSKDDRDWCRMIIEMIDGAVETGATVGWP